MSDRIRELTKEIFENPGSPRFVDLGALLRENGDLTGAERVLAAGVARHPDLAAGSSLYGEVLLDRGKLREAFHEWTRTLGLDPRDVGARKGLGYLFFKGGQYDEALEHLETALSADPSDQHVVLALFRVRQALEGTEEDRVQDGRGDTMLSDARGRPLTGGIRSGGADVSEEVAAYLVNVSAEAERASRMLDLGQWQSILCEGDRGCMFVSQPDEQAFLVVVGAAGFRPAEVELRAEAATTRARDWLEASRRAD